MKERDQTKLRRPSKSKIQLTSYSCLFNIQVQFLQTALQKSYVVNYEFIFLFLNLPVEYSPSLTSIIKSTVMIVIYQKSHCVSVSTVLLHYQWRFMVKILRYMPSVVIRLKIANQHVPTHVLMSYKVSYQIVKGHLRSGCSGMAMRSHSRFTLYWLLTLEVRLPNGWRGIVPMTKGSSRHSLDVPGTSTQTWWLRD